MPQMENKPVPVLPSDWAKEKQEEALDNNDTDTALAYYELAKIWLERGM